MSHYYGPGGVQCGRILPFCRPGMGGGTTGICTVVAASVPVARPVAALRLWMGTAAEPMVFACVRVLYA